MKGNPIIFFAALLCAVAAAVTAGAEPARWSVYRPAGGADVRFVAVDPGGYAWVRCSTDGGDRLAVIDRAGVAVMPLKPADGIGEAAVSAVAFETVDAGAGDDYRSGAVWIGTDRGLIVVDRSGVATRMTPRTTPLPGAAVSAVYIDSGNTKWIAVDGRGISCVDREFNWHTYTVSDGLCSRNIIAVQEDRNGNMWFGSADRGVSLLDRVGRWQHFSAENSGLIGNRVSAIAAEDHSRLWFLTAQGVSVFDGQNWTSYTSRNSPLGTASPTALVIDAAGNKWIGSDGGLFRLDRLGMWTHYHPGNSALPDRVVRYLTVDREGAVWIATPAGVCRTAGSAAPAGGEYQAPFNGEAVQSFASGIMWENIGASDRSPGVAFALPAFPRESRSWFYAALWEDQDFDFQKLSYRIVGDRLGNSRVEFGGPFAQALFLVSGAVAGSTPSGAYGAGVRYPFPQRYPEVLAGLVQPGRWIPSADPELVALADSLVRPASRSDMAATVRDIVYSPLMQQLQLDHRDIGLNAEREPGEENARIGSARDVYHVLKTRSADTHAKARLVCTLIRAAGVPARIVMNIAGSAWCQAWIAGAGWVSIDVAYPVFDYIRPNRTGMPKVLLPADHALAAVSGTDDDTGIVFWSEDTKAYYAMSRPDQLQRPEQIVRARLLFMPFVAEERVPGPARLPLGENLFAFAQQREGHHRLLFQDAAGAALQAAPLVFDGLPQFVNVGNRLLWRYIPRKISGLLVLENLECVSR